MQSAETTQDHQAASPLEALRTRYLAAQLSGDRREAVRLVLEEGLHRGHAVSELQAEVIQSAQQKIGELWQQNRISIAQEHMATAISHVVLARLFEEAPPAISNGKRVVVACVEGELHEFPARLVADFLELAGYQVRYLGANVPLHDLVKLLAAEPTDLLALSVTMSFNAGALHRGVERIRAEFPSLPILVGGHALSWEPELATRFGVQTCGAGSAAVLDAARRLTAKAVA